MYENDLIRDSKTIEKKFIKVEDINCEIFSEDLIKNLENEFVFMNGNPIYSEAASDNIFANILSLKFLKVERKVEIYDPIAKLWEPLILRGYNYFI
jgi:hypothetical protein